MIRSGYARTGLALGAIAALAGSASPAHCAENQDDLFQSFSFQEAMDQSEGSDRWVLVFVEADWCEPCAKMDDLTWPNPAVRRWVGTESTAIRIDADTDSEWADQFNVHTLPATILFRNSEEFDRLVGRQQPIELVEWFSGVEEGRRATDALRDAAGPRESPDCNLEMRLDLAEALMDNSRYQEAADEFAWLWNAIPERTPELTDIRASYMAEAMQELVGLHDPARYRFSPLRDQIDEAFQQRVANHEDLYDWIQLSIILDDTDAILEWHDDAKGLRASGTAFSEVADVLFDVLVDAHRWVDAGDLLEDPVEQASDLSLFFSPEAEEAAMLDRLPDQRRFELEAYRKEMSRLYAACLAVERDDEARRIAGMLLHAHNNAESRIQLVSTAIQAGAVRSHQLKLLDRANELGEDIAWLRDDLNEFLTPSNAVADVPTDQ